MKDFKSALRTVRPLARQRVDEPRTVPPPEPEPEFRQLFADVTPLRDDGRYHAPPARPSPRPRNKKADGGYSAALEQELMRQLVGWFEPAECDRQFVRGGVNATTLKRLRNGHWPCSGQLDLHGLDRFQAQDALAVFIHRARRRGNCVRIIHGKGFGSGGEPVLRHVVRAWLRHHPDVLAFSEADETAGGSGALLVLLKRFTPTDTEQP